MMPNVFASVPDRSARRRPCDVRAQERTGPRIRRRHRRVPLGEACRPSGEVYGLDMTDQMLRRRAAAARNAAREGSRHPVAVARSRAPGESSRAAGRFSTSPARVDATPTDTIDRATCRKSRGTSHVVWDVQPASDHADRAANRGANRLHRSDPVCYHPAACRRDRLSRGGRSTAALARTRGGSDELVRTATTRGLGSEPCTGIGRAGPAAGGRVARLRAVRPRQHLRNHQGRAGRRHARRRRHRHQHPDAASGDDRRPTAAASTPSPTCCPAATIFSPSSRASRK